MAHWAKKCGFSPVRLVGGWSSLSYLIKKGIFGQVNVEFLLYFIKKRQFPAQKPRAWAPPFCFRSRDLRQSADPKLQPQRQQLIRNWQLKPSMSQLTSKRWILPADKLAIKSQVEHQLESTQSRWQLVQSSGWSWQETNCITCPVSPSEAFNCDFDNQNYQTLIFYY